MTSPPSKPTVSWADFLDCTPHFDYLLFGSEGSLENEMPALQSAIGFFNWFSGEVSNGGLAQFFSNARGKKRLLSKMPTAVRAHPELQDIADLIDEAFARPELGAADENSPAHDEFNKRAWPRNDAARKRIQHHIIQHPPLYFDFENPHGLRGKGVETLEISGKRGVWRVRFVDGFPVGPNILEEETGAVRVVRFSRSREHLEYDLPWHDDTVQSRNWIDFTTGLCGRRDFKNGKLQTLSTDLDSQLNYRFSDRFDDTGRSLHTELIVKGTSLRVSNRDLDNAPFVLKRFADDGLSFHRYYFSNGQLNAEVTFDGSGTGRYTASFDEKGSDLAPGGDGELRLLVAVSEDGQTWRHCKLVDAYLDGRLVQLRPDGSIAYEQQWRRGDLKQKRP